MSEPLIHVSVSNVSNFILELIHFEWKLSKNQTKLMSWLNYVFFLAYYQKIAGNPVPHSKISISKFHSKYQNLKSITNENI